MSAAKHTAGPWSVGRHREVLAKRGNDLVVICEVYSGGCESLEEADANANLIAAAPELLAAAQAFIALTDLSGWKAEPGSDVAKARAAVAKATGSAP